MPWKKLLIQVGHQWYWSYEFSDFEVAPKVTGENLELIEKSVKNLKDCKQYGLSTRQYCLVVQLSYDIRIIRYSYECG